MMAKDSKEEYYSVTEIVVRIKALWCFIVGRWGILLLTIMAGAGLGSLYYIWQKPKFKAEITFILEEKSSSGGNLAGLASQFGFNIGSLSGEGSMFSGDNILNILTSKKIVQQVLLSPIDDKKTLADLYLDFTGTTKAWRQKPRLANLNFANASEQLSPVQDSVLNDVYQKIVSKNVQADHLSKQSTIVSVTVTAPNSEFARLLAERLVDAAGKLYLDVKTSNAMMNIRELQRRSDSLLILLNRKSYSAATSQPLDFNPGIRSAIVPTEIATRDKTVLAAVYGEVTKSLEMSKLMLAQQTPVIQILDKPSILLDDNRKSLGFLAFVFSLGSFALGLLILTGLFLLNQKMDCRRIAESRNEIV